MICPNLSHIHPISQDEVTVDVSMSYWSNLLYKYLYNFTPLHGIFMDSIVCLHGSTHVTHVTHVTNIYVYIALGSFITAYHIYIIITMGNE